MKPLIENVCMFTFHIKNVDNRLHFLVLDNTAYYADRYFIDRMQNMIYEKY